MRGAMISPGNLDGILWAGVKPVTPPFNSGDYIIIGNNNTDTSQDALSPIWAVETATTITFYTNGASQNQAYYYYIPDTVVSSSSSGGTVINGGGTSTVSMQAASGTETVVHNISHTGPAELSYTINGQNILVDSHADSGSWMGCWLHNTNTAYYTVVAPAGLACFDGIRTR